MKFSLPLLENIQNECHKFKVYNLVLTVVHFCEISTVVNKSFLFHHPQKIITAS